MKANNSKILAGVAALALLKSASCLPAQPALPAYYAPSCSGTPTSTVPGPFYTTPLSGKLYLGFDIGVALQQDITMSDAIGDNETVTFDSGARLDCQLGYNLTRNWAAELEVGLIISPVKHSLILGTDFMDVDYTELPVMLNVIYTRPLGHHFSAYVGGGVGGVFSQYSDEFGDSTPSDSAFAFQGMAGIKCTLNDRWDRGVTYKFLGTTEHDVGSGFDSNGNPTEFKSDGTMTHSVLVALTCKF